MFAFQTVAQGQRMAVWDREGRRTIVEGPKRVNVWGRKVVPLETFVAGPRQYLIVQYRDGRIEHRQGPTVFWKDDVEHLRVTVAEAIVLDGSEAIAVNLQAEAKVERRVVHGPEMFVPAAGEWVERLATFVAGPTQYLVVNFRDGRAEHIRGPVVFWRDEVEHLKVAVREAVPLDANEAVVVYRQNGGKVERRVVRGPELFVPAAEEYLHEFHWHGADPKDPKRKIPNTLVFTKLRVIPDQMYFDVASVRTSDDALMSVKLMIFFELMEIEVMLDQTHDVVSDFINAVTADVIDFAGKLTFEGFKEKTELLNQRETYPQLATRLGRIGYRLNKVVYRGYQAGEKLQAMHDGAIEARTRLKLDAETEVQAQELADLKLQREQDRARQRQEMRQAEVLHEQRVRQIAHEQELRQRQAEQEQAVTAQRLSGDLKLAQRQAVHLQRVRFLQSVREMEVDMTRYLVAKSERPDRKIRLEGDRRTQLHLHEG